MILKRGNSTLRIRRFDFSNELLRFREIETAAQSTQQSFFRIQNPFKARQASFQTENIQENPHGIICTVKKNGTRPLWARGDGSTELSFPFVVISPRGRQHLLGNAVDTSERPVWLIVPRAVGH